MSRQKGEKPTAIQPDTAYLPLTCDGNGDRQAKAQSPSCSITIAASTPMFVARWPTSPHLTVHCRACRDFYFAAQRSLL